MLEAAGSTNQKFDSEHDVFLRGAPSLGWESSASRGELLSECARVARGVKLSESRIMNPAVAPTDYVQ